MRILLAGATGAVGRRLTPMLVAAGHDVTGTTRSPAKASGIAAAGATPVVVDAYDAAALRAAVLAARPEVVIHQLTDLPQERTPENYESGRERNSRLRIEGTPRLAAAAREAGAKRFISQSVTFAYAPGPEPHGEDDPLDRESTEPSRQSLVRGITVLENATLQTPGLDGVVLRYGLFYGLDTWYAAAAARGSVHIDAAAHAALLAVARAAPGIYNIAEDDGLIAIAKARRDLGFDPAFRLGAGTAG